MSEEVTAKILDAIRGVPGLRPAVPVLVPWESLAVELSAEVVRIRLVATKLPLPPLLESASDAVRPLLSGTPWEHARLRLEVTDVDGSAFR